MKKKFLVATIVLCIACLLIFSVACDSGKKPSEDDAYVTSVVFEEKEITLESGKERTLNYTVTPADGEVDFALPADGPVELEIVSDGVVKIKALRSGNCKLKVSAAKNQSIFDECNITVELPLGYATYKNFSDMQFAYPASWQKTTAVGTIVSYQDMETGNNINLTSQSKNTAILNLTASDFKNVLKAQYQQLGWSVVFENCSVAKYNNNKSLRVVMEYVVNGMKFYQEQFISNSSSKMYVLTLTFVGDNVDKSIANTVFKEFVVR